MLGETNDKNENIQNTNQTSVDNPRIGHDSGFNELPFSEHGESDDIEVVNTDDIHIELDSDDESKSVEQISEAHNEIKVDQISTVQSPVSTEYATPPAYSESSYTKTINNNSNSIEQEDDTDNDTDELALEDSPESKNGE